MLFRSIRFSVASWPWLKLDEGDTEAKMRHRSLKRAQPQREKLLEIGWLRRFHLRTGDKQVDAVVQPESCPRIGRHKADAMPSTQEAPSSASAQHTGRGEAHLSAIR